MINVMNLKKGDWITPKQCSKVVGLPPDHPHYPLRLLWLSARIEKEWMDEREERVTLCHEKNGIRVCTDDEAVSVNRARRRQHVSSLTRTQDRLVGIDRSKLTTPEIRHLHEREVICGAAFLLGGRERERLELEAHVRSTPTMG